MAMNPPWKAQRASTKATRQKPTVATRFAAPYLTEADRPPATGVPCDGYESGRLLGIHGRSAVDVICERVAKFGAGRRSSS